jgi:hypothetical protein
MKLKYIIPLCLALESQLALPSLADISPTKRTVNVSVEREPIALAEPVYRAYATAGNVKFTFIIPDKFHMSGGVERGAFHLDGPELNATIGCAFLDVDVSNTDGLNPDEFREMLLNRHPGAKITGEFKAGALGKTGPGFDLQWKTETGIVQNCHMVFIPTAAGVLQVGATVSGTGHTQPAVSAMNMILTTLNASGPDGKLQVMRLSNRM